jgi:hypothetical protein
MVLQGDGGESDPVVVERKKSVGVMQIGRSDSAIGSGYEYVADVGVQPSHEAEEGAVSFVSKDGEDVTLMQLDDVDEDEIDPAGSFAEILDQLMGL